MSPFIKSLLKMTAANDKTKAFKKNKITQPGDTPNKTTKNLIRANAQKKHSVLVKTRARIQKVSNGIIC